MPGLTPRKTARAATRTVSPRSGKDTSKPRAKIGRPPKLQLDEETLRKIENLGKIQCTTKEAAAVLDVSEPTFIDFLKRHEKAADAFEKGKQSGKASLRRMQLKSAEAGNVTMLIWLGKQLLGQRDRQELTGNDGGPIEVSARNTSIKLDLARKLARLAGGDQGAT